MRARLAKLWYRGFGGMVAAGTVLCAAVSATGPAAGAPRERPEPYAFAPDARSVEGASGTAQARRLAPGKTYRSVLPKAGKRYFRLELGATENAYVSATAVPAPGTEVTFKDGYSLAVENGDGITCRSARARFGSSESPRPLTAWAARTTGPGSGSCRNAGPYYVVVEQEGEAPRTAWDLELRFSAEPQLSTPGPSEAPTPEASLSPAPVAGAASTRAGGSGFATAPRLAHGVWQDHIRPGQTLYYRVPVDWGERLSAHVELGSLTDGVAGPDGPDGPDGPGGGRGLGRFVPSALVVDLFNPARGPVDQVQSSYDGKQKVAALGTLPPVRYENRFAGSDRVNGMRFSGRYYLAVHLRAAVAEQFGDERIGVKLRLGVKEAPAGFGPVPVYDGQPLPAEEFRPAAEEEAPEPGTDGPTASAFARGPVMRTVAFAAFGTGTALVLVLVVWTVVARRGSPGAGAPRT
ncbi:hypothetical protein ACSMX9_14040 [Streptomyces sp. LE64]|uniref:hypothetical protein n=1 Tax=Streptomyces sp. LE64 TaxID=3448653 RepID=UPI004042BF25